MSGLFPQIEPIPLADADVPYTGKLVWMDISPRLVDNALDATATIRTRPYRILASGQIEMAPDSMDVVAHFPSVAQAMTSDPRVAKAIGMIAQAVQEYVNPPQE